MHLRHVIRRYLFTALFMALLGCQFATSNAEDTGALPKFHCPPSQTCLNFTTMNDVYLLLPHPANEPGTLARVAPYLNEIRGAFPQQQFLFAGDLLSPSPESQLTKGMHMVSALNALGLDAATLGNHEFDFGPEALEQAAALSKFPWLAANVRVKNPQRLNPKAFKPYTMLAQKGKRILVFGLLTPETYETNDVAEFLEIEDPIGSTKRQLAGWIQQEKPDLVIALTHLTVAQDRALAAAIPEIDAIFGGHDHHQLLQVVNETPIIKLDSDAKTIGHVQFNLANTVPLKTVETKGWFGRKKTVTLPGDPLVEWHYEVTALTAQTHPADAAFSAAIEEQYGLGGMDKALGSLPLALDLRQSQVRGGYSASAQYLAGLLREVTGADVALLNGGGIRTDGKLAAHQPLTHRDVLKMLPFANRIAVLQLSTDELKKALEYSLARGQQEPGWGGRLHVSGLILVVDENAPDGAKIQQLLDAKTGRALALKAVHRVAMSEYLAEGGNGYDMFKAAATSAPAGLNVATETQAQAVIKAISGFIPERLSALAAEAPSIQFQLQPVK